MTATMTDRQRDALAASWFAALLLLYRARMRATLDRLGRFDAPATVSGAVQDTVRAFTAERARLVQAGLSNAEAAALAAAPDGQDAAITQGQTKIAVDAYNHTVLLPFLASWAAHQALVDVYTDTPAPSSDGTTVSLRNAVLWTWTQNTTFTDDCTEAENASPAPLDDLTAITGGIPPVHPRCGCTLEPADLPLSSYST